MKKEYVSPVIYVERFDANDYIAACSEYRIEFVGCQGNGTWEITVNSLPNGITDYTTATLLATDGSGYSTRTGIYGTPDGSWIIDGSLGDSYHQGLDRTDGCYYIQNPGVAFAATCVDEGHHAAVEMSGSHFAVTTGHHHLTPTAIHNVS